MVFATHDRHLVEAVATHVGRVGGGRLEVRAGVRPSDFEPVLAGASEEVRVEESGGAVAHAERKQRARRLESLRRRGEEIEAAIHDAEGELAAVDRALSGAELPAGEIAELARRRAAVESRIAALFSEWETVEASTAADG